MAREQQYLKVIQPVQAHSDNNYFPDRDVYVVKNLPFHSKAANVSFRQLDEVIKESKMIDGKRRVANAHRCVRVRKPANAIFPKAPKHMLVDFYDFEWFNDKLPAQRQALANTNLVAFLENPLDSFWFKDPLKKAGNRRFVKERCYLATKGYNMDFIVKPEVEVDSNSPDDDSDYGGSIDLGSSNSETTSDGSGGGDNPVAMDAEAGGSRRVDENYEMFDYKDKEMDLAHFGKGSYSGGVPDSKWNTWK
ncbi:hypothetical protein PCASD_16662 [Puccinia coronata f. sp. avenae]|uniref:Uncharacterized protein n=1 Tax=Puccinia coronata f. sp. avenae TaxID=200324 RepID=A0A2N5T4Q0_9BASI|nr:hypothetical protein PCASD_16662 [Puccinia coronata f. sp. avenae]